GRVQVPQAGVPADRAAPQPAREDRPQRAGLSRGPFGLNVARGLLRDAVSGRDRIPYLDERLLGRVGPLAGAERGVVGARLAARRASALSVPAGPGPGNP